MRLSQRLVIYTSTRILLPPNLCSPSPLVYARAEPPREQGEGDGADDGADGDGPQGDEIGLCIEYTRAGTIVRAGRVVGDLKDKDLQNVRRVRVS